MAIAPHVGSTPATYGPPLPALISSLVPSGMACSVSERLHRALTCVSLRQIDQYDVRVLPDTVEHDRFPVRHYVEGLYPAATT